MALTLRQRATARLEDMREQESNAAAERISDLLCKLFGLSLTDISIRQWIDPDGDPLTYAEVDGIKFVQAWGDDDDIVEAQPLRAVNVFRPCLCGQPIILGPVEDLDDLALVLSRPVIAREMCPHETQPKPLVEGRFKVGNILTSVPPSGMPAQVGLLIDPSQNAAAAQLEPGATYRIAIWTLAPESA